MNINRNLPAFFVIAAVVLNSIYLYHFTPLLRSYPHGAERFLHVVHLAEEALGKPDRLPVSMLELVAEAAPNHVDNVSAIPCNQWEAGIRERYCHRPPAYSPQMASFSNLLRIPLEPEHTFAFVPHRAAAQFPAIGYLFYAVGAWVALLLGLSPVIVLYSAVLCNAAATIALGYYILKLLPILRWPVAYLLLAPTMLMDRTLVMPDALVAGLCFLALAISLRLRYVPVIPSLCREEVRKGAQYGKTEQVSPHPNLPPNGEGIDRYVKLSLTHYAALIGLAAVIGIIKIAYFLVPVVFLLIPEECFGRRRIKIAIVALALACAAASGIGWALYVAGQYGFEDRLSGTGSLAFRLMAHPVDYALSIAATLFDSHMIAIKIDNILTWNLCWIHGLPMNVFLFSPLILLAICPGESETITLHRLERLLMLAIAIGSATILYIVQLFDVRVPVGLSGIQYAVQGRYFIPVIPFALLAAYDVVRIRITYVLIAFLLGCLLCLHYGQLTRPVGFFARCSVVMPGYGEH